MPVGVVRRYMNCVPLSRTVVVRRVTSVEKLESSHSLCTPKIKGEPSISVVRGKPGLRFTSYPVMGSAVPLVAEDSTGREPMVIVGTVGLDSCINHF